MLGDQRVDHSPRFHVHRMAVISRERLAALEIANQRKVDRSPPALEAAPDLESHQARATSGAKARCAEPSAVNCGLFIGKASTWRVLFRTSGFSICRACSLARGPARTWPISARKSSKWSARAAATTRGHSV